MKDSSPLFFIFGTFIFCFGLMLMTDTYQGTLESLELMPGGLVMGIGAGIVLFGFRVWSREGDPFDR